MKRIAFILASLFFISGCAPVLIGAAGVVTGYTLSNDSAIGNVKSEYRILWDLCLDKIESMNGKILYSNESRGIIKARILENNLTIRIDSLSSETQRLKVSSRKYLLPKPQFAQKIFLNIVDAL